MLKNTLLGAAAAGALLAATAISVQAAPIAPSVERNAHTVQHPNWNWGGNTYQNRYGYGYRYQRQYYEPAPYYAPGAYYGPSFYFGFGPRYHHW